MPGKFDWTASSGFCRTHLAIFKKLTQESGQPTVTGEQLKNVLSGSPLPTTLLAQIWVLSSTPGSKTLGDEEFLTCLFLVSAAANDVKLPETLPKDLTKSIRKFIKEEGASVEPTPSMTPSSSSSKIRTSRRESPDRAKKSGGTESAPSSGKRTRKWTMSKEEKRRFSEVFAANSQDGFVSGEIAVRVFGQSGLSRPDLASIWALSDMDRDQNLSQQEFCIAMHLITRRLQGVELPATVPASLVMSASTDPKRKPSRQGSTRSPTVVSPGAPSHRSSMIVNVPVTDPSQDPSSRPALQRSSSTAEYHPPVDTNSTTRAPLPRAMSGFTGGSTYSSSASELPHDALGSSHSSLYSSSSFLSTSRASPPVTVAAYGVDDRIIPEYDSSIDLSKLEAVTDLPTVRLLMSQLSEEVKSLGTALDKSQLQHESLNEKLATRMDQNAMSQRRRANFETILRNYNQQLEADVSLYESLKSELGELSAEIESQQHQLNSPQFDVVQLRERRKALQAEYGRVKAESNASHEEHTRLVLEVEKLKAAGAEQASKIDVNWSDHGFKEEPALAFGDSDLVASNSSSNLAAPAGSNFAPSFSFQAGGFGTASGTMTPNIDDFDFNDGASEAGDVDVDLGWLKPEGPATSASTADFFASESANWANFSMQEDVRNRERAASISAKSTSKKPASRKSKDASTLAKSPSEKSGKKKKH